MKTTTKVIIWLYAMLGLSLVLAVAAGDLHLFPWIWIVLSGILTGSISMFFLIDSVKKGTILPWNRVICDRHTVWVRVVGTLRVVGWGYCPVCKRQMRPEKEDELSEREGEL